MRGNVLLHCRTGIGFAGSSSLPIFHCTYLKAPPKIPWQKHTFPISQAFDIQAIIFFTRPKTVGTLLALLPEWTAQGAGIKPEGNIAAGAIGDGSTARFRCRRIVRMTSPWVMAAMIRSTPR
jgi:hypothetical protein